MGFTAFIAEQWLLLSLLTVLIAALVFVESKRGGDSLSFHGATRLLNDDAGIVVDVREAKEFKAGHIVGAVNIPHTKLADQLSQLEKHKGKTIIVADKMGQHSGAAGRTLKDNGYTAARLQGGMAEWVNQNLPVVKA